MTSTPTFGSRIYGTHFYAKCNPDYIEFENKFVVIKAVENLKNICW